MTDEIGREMLKELQEIKAILKGNNEHYEMQKQSALAKQKIMMDYIGKISPQAKELYESLMGGNNGQ